MPTPAARWTLLCALAVWLLVSTLPNPRPDPVPEAAPAAQFSAGRAMRHVAAIAQRPHPTGTPDHDRVRDYIRVELTKLGLASQFQTAGPIENIVARRPGTRNTRPAMLMAHYDSTPNGPGAGDDAHGVAVLLETARALRASAPLHNDVIFLFTDAEEQGLLGANLFLREHPWAREPGMVLNFDAPGTSGPSYMFETSAENTWLVEALAVVAPRTQSMSMANDAIRRMPIGTDFAVFKAAGLSGMNFAFGGGLAYNHGPEDSLAHLDPRSVQETGNYALSLARLFGNRDLTAAHRGNSTWFPTRITPLIVYPEGWVRPLAWIALAGLAATAWSRRRSLLIPLTVVAALATYVAYAAPSAAYLLEWPLLSGVIALAVVRTAPKVISLGWRIAALAILPGAVFLLLVPFASMVIDGIGVRGAAPVLAAVALLILACVAPQLAVILRRS